MQFVLKLDKRLGETPLECVERFRLENPVYERVNMTYVGRLDPMAEGLLLVLAGDTKDKDEFLALDKAYEFEVLWGFETDTYDTLGVVTGLGPMPEKLDRKMDALLENIENKRTQEYPPYSSRTVSGKPLHAWAREGRLGEIAIPTRQIKIFNIEHIHTKLLKQKDVLEEVLKRIDCVQGDFRQKEIKKSWEKAINKKEFCLVSKFKADVSSGTYIRSLAHEMGQKLGTSALAMSIKRTRVGSYKL